MAAAGANVTCTSVITNTGTDWLHDVTVAGQDCESFLLKPGMSTTCQTHHLTTQTHFDNYDAYGELFEAAVAVQAHSLSNSSRVVFAQDAAHIELLLEPAITLFLRASTNLVTAAGEHARLNMQQLCMLYFYAWHSNSHAPPPMANLQAPAKHLVAHAE